jgi:hypothetical protein
MVSVVRHACPARLLLLDRTERAPVANEFTSHIGRFYQPMVEACDIGYLRVAYCGRHDVQSARASTGVTFF